MTAAARKPQPLRAMLGAHFTTHWMSSMRRSGRGSFWTQVVLGGALMLAYLALILGSTGLAGWHVGRFLAARLATAEAVVSGALTAYVLIFGCTAALEAGTRRLPWAQLRIFPVTTRSLVAAELCVSALDLSCLVPLLGLLTFCTTASIRTPRAAPAYALLFVTHALLLLTLPLVVGGILQRLSRKLKLTLCLLPVVAFLLTSAGLIRIAAVLPREAAFALFRRGRVLAHLQPSHALVVAANDLQRGELALLPAATAPLAPVALTLTLLLAAYWLISREAPRAQANAGASKRLWTFTHPTWGVARLQWSMLIGSMQGRVALVFPLLGLVFSQSFGPPFGTAFGYTYGGFALTGFLCNQFGLDRHGVKVLLLLPVDERSLLRGKLLGHALLAAAQVLILTTLYVAFRVAPATDIAAGIGAYGCVFLLLGMMGMPFSVWAPRPIRTGGARTRAPLLLLLLLLLGALPTCGLVVGGILLATTVWLPGWELAVLGALFVVLLGSFELLLRASARYLARHRERLVEQLSGAA